MRVSYAASIWQGRTRIGPSVRQRPPRFSNITESVGCLHAPYQVVPGTFVDYAFLFFLFSASGGWVKIKLELPHFHLCIRYMSCFDSTHAPVSTAAHAAGAGLVSMSTRPDIPGMLHLEREARDWSTYNEYSYRIILLLLLLYVYCSRAHPRFPSKFRRRRLQDFFYLYRKLTKILVGRQFSFLCGRQVHF